MGMSVKFKGGKKNGRRERYRVLTVKGVDAVA